MRFRFRALDFDPIAFSDVNLANQNSRPMRKSWIYFRAEIRATPRPIAVAVVWGIEETRWVRRTARRTKASEPTLAAFGLAAKRLAECAIVNLSWYFVFHNVIGCICCVVSPNLCCYVRLRVRIYEEVRAECSSLGL